MVGKKFNKQILRKYRKILFPIIAKEIITGYNVYTNRSPSKSKYMINYLHSDLGFENARPQMHLSELIDRLNKFGPPNITNEIVNSVVDRIAMYKIGDWEDNPAGLKFYDKDGKRLSKDLLKNYRGLIVAEGKQYDLGIEICSRQDLNKVLNLFNKYTFVHKINRNGQLINKDGQICFNKNAIHGAWEIPLIIVSANQMRRKDFSNIAELVIVDKEHEISTLVDKALVGLEKELNIHKLNYSILRKFVDRAFVELYINA